MPAVSRYVLQVLLFLQDTLKASPESLGDARKETAEELAERHERVVAASLLALSSLLDLLVSKDQHNSPTGMVTAFCTVHHIKYTLKCHASPTPCMPCVRLLALIWLVNT